MVGKLRILMLAGVMTIGAMPAFAQAIDTRTLKNQSVTAAQQQLNQRGYAKTNTLVVNNQRWDYYRGPTGHCLGFTYDNGRVIDARDSAQEQCTPQLQANNGGGQGPSNGGNRFNPPGQNNNNRFSVDQLRNMGVKTAQQTLANNNYNKVRSINYQGKQWDLYESRGTCIGFASLYGNVSDTRTFEARDCGNDNNNFGNNGNGFGNGRGRFDTDQLRNQRVNTVQDRLRSSGFQKVRTTTIDGKQWDLWYNDNYREGCVGFTSYNGTVTATDTFSNSRCGDDDRGGFGNNGFGNGGFGNNRPTRTFDLNAFSNMSVNQAQSALGRNGYGKTKSIKLNNQQWDLYLNDDYKNSCVGFTSYNGQVTQTRNFDDRDCR